VRTAQEPGSLAFLARHLATGQELSASWLITATLALASRRSSPLALSSISADRPWWVAAPTRIVVAPIS
jgi:hypothetical protein